jgi:hypothetical protein
VPPHRFLLAGWNKDGTGEAITLYLFSNNLVKAAELNRRLAGANAGLFQGLFYDEHDANGRARGIGDTRPAGDLPRAGCTLPRCDVFRLAPGFLLSLYNLLHSNLLPESQAAQDFWSARK